VYARPVTAPSTHPVSVGPDVQVAGPGSAVTRKPLTPEPAAPAVQVTPIEASPATATTAGAPGVMLGVTSCPALGAESTSPRAKTVTVYPVVFVSPVMVHEVPGDGSVHSKVGVLRPVGTATAW
jgi:hypothetical protein